MKKKENLLSLELFNPAYQKNNINLYTLENNHITCQITNFGARVVKLFTQDKNKEFENIVLGYSCLDDYLADPFFMGAFIGPYANRIKNGQFKLNSKTYQLEKNDQAKHTLHCGENGFHNKTWNLLSQKTDSLLLGLDYQNEKYPGALTLQLHYQLEENKLKIESICHAKEDSFVNLTQHLYFNLQGDCSKHIENHEIEIHSDKLSKIDNDFIPTEETISLDSMDIQSHRAIKLGRLIKNPHPQIKLAKGLDHNFILTPKNEPSEQKIPLAIKIADPHSQRTLSLYTKKPCVQIYSGNMLKAPFKPHQGFCLEDQFIPNNLNTKNNHRSFVKKNSLINNTTLFKFSIF